MDKEICQECKGNGFIRIEDHPDIRKQSVKDCEHCDNQGEIIKQKENENER